MKFILNLFFILLFLVLPVSIFGQTEKKAVYGVLIDNTGSMRTQFDNIQTLAKSIARNVSQQGEVSLFKFQTEGSDKKQFAIVSKGTEWSRDKDALENYIGKLQVVPGQTVLFDSIRSIAKTIDAKAVSEKLTEKILILITDGEDRTSEVTEKQLFKELKESNIKVYAVGLITELDSERSLFGDSAKERAAQFLKKITKETGGKAIFPKLKKNTKIEDSLTELFSEPSK